MSQRVPKRLMKARPRLSSLVSPPIRRALAVIGLAALAGLAALVALRDDPKTYERESSFAIRPSETVPPEQLPDVVGTLSQPDGAVTQTIVDILASARLRESAADAAGLPPGSVGGSGAEYSWTASRRPGSAIVEIKLTGPSDANLLAMQAEIPEEAASLVAGSFGLYRLESLNAPTSSPKQIGPKTEQTVVLALLLGAFVGIALVFVEGRLRSSLGRRPVNPGDDGPPTGNNHLSGETNRLESTLRESPGGASDYERRGGVLETGGFARRVRPSRIEMPYPEAPPRPETAPPKRETPSPKREAAPPKAEAAPSKPETARRKRGRRKRESAGRKGETGRRKR